MTLIFLILPLFAYALFFAAIIYHLKKYCFRDPLSRKLIIVYVVVSLSLAVLAVFLYLNVDWEGIMSLLGL